MAQADRRLGLPARSETDDDPAVAAVLNKVSDSFGFVPNVYANMANAPALLEAYLTTQTAYRKNSGFNAAEREIISLAISRVHACTYCVAVHSTLADGAKVPTKVVDAIRAGKPAPDERYDALARFATVMVETRGLPT